MCQVIINCKLICRKVTDLSKDKSYLFQKGKSGNPKGRPPVKGSWAGLMRSYGEDTDKDGQSRKARIVEKLFAMAEAGEGWAIKEILDRVEGKAIARVEQDVTSNGKALGARIQFVANTQEIVDTTAEPIEDARELEAGE